MNVTSKSLIAAAAFAIVATSASASEAYGEQTVGQSTLSRAEVTAELFRAQRSGEITQSAEDYGSVGAAQFAARNDGLSRTQVRSELSKAQNDNSYVSSNEAYGTVVPGTSFERFNSAE